MRYRPPAEFFRFHDDRSMLEELFEMLLGVIFIGVAIVAVIAAVLMGIDYVLGTSLSAGFVDWVTGLLDGIGSG